MMRLKELFGFVKAEPKEIADLAMRKLTRTIPCQGENLLSTAASAFSVQVELVGDRVGNFNRDKHQILECIRKRRRKQ